MKKSNTTVWLARTAGLILGLFSVATLHATIISTSVDAGMEIRFNTPLAGSIVDATATDSGATSASVAINGNITGASAYSNLGFSSLGAESAIFDFDLGYNGGGYLGTGYLGQSGFASNLATLEYTAVSNFDMTVDWNFDYSGANPFGLQVVNLTGGPSERLGNFGRVGNITGSTSYALNAGDTYLFELLFEPNVSGGIGGINGALSGLFDFNFDTVNVPEPAGLLLLLFGLAVLKRVRPG